MKNTRDIKCAKCGHKDNDFVYWVRGLEKWLCDNCYSQMGD
jgi:NMD protein affecting ribosome stability and mRNA decay